MEKMRNLINCIIPPYILEKILLKGDEKQREIALRQIKQANFMRLRRVSFSESIETIKKIVTPGVDAHSQRLVRRIYSADNLEFLPGRLVRNEGDPESGDCAVDEVYEGVGNTWKFYKEIYKRNSIDDRGMEIKAVVHYGDMLNNAFWDGEQLIFGDGDGIIFGSFTSDLDIIAHEFTHGVIQYEANLKYWFQSGALNESLADIFASLTKQYTLNQDVKEADWLIGENVLLGENYALRSLKAPGEAYLNHPILGDDPQPKTMDEYEELDPWNDNGGVHLNSGIPNFAFYLSAYEIGGYAWEKAGKIWYRALCDKFSSETNFFQAATATLQVARELFGSGSLEEKAIERAWKEVKVI